jgi:AcrR family transcriptional regulator
MLAENGIRGLRMDAIAARAGVSKATVYRRWKTKEALIAEALQAVAVDPETFDTGNTRDDLVALLLEGGRVSEEFGVSMAQLMAGAAADPELFELCRRTLVDPRRRAQRAVLRRAIARGDLHADLDVDLAIEIVMGPALYSAMYSGHRRPIGAKRAQRIADLLLAGLAAQP